MPTPVEAQLWELAFSGSSLMTRVLALVRLSELDPERVKELYRQVNTECSNDTGSFVNTVTPGKKDDRN
jgi:hypothetical protein